MPRRKFTPPLPAPGMSRGVALYAGCGADALPLLLRSFREAHDEIVFAEMARTPADRLLLLSALTRQLSAYDVPFTPPRRHPARPGEWSMLVGGTPFRLLTNAGAAELLAEPHRALLAEVTTLWVGAGVPWILGEPWEGEPQPEDAEEAAAEAGGRGKEEAGGRGKEEAAEACASFSPPERLPSPPPAPLPLPLLEAIYIRDVPRLLRERFLARLPAPPRLTVSLPRVAFAPHVLAARDNPFGERMVLWDARGRVFLPFCPSRLERPGSLSMRR